MIKDIYIATIVENCGSGENFGSILHADTPEGLKEEIVNYLETEVNERDLDIDYDDGDILLACIHGNEQSGPDIINVKDWDTEFLLLTKKVCVSVEEKVKKTIFTVTTQYEDQSNGENTASSRSFPSREEARKYLKDCYDCTRQSGHINDPVVLPGLFADRCDAELCDGNLQDYIQPDHITVWDGQGCSFEGKITKQEIEF